MGLGKKILGGMAKGAKGIWNISTMDNLTPATGGGLTSAVITKQINPIGFGLLGTGIALGGIAKEAWGARNRHIMGRVTYQDGLTRMVGSHTTGAVPAMMRVSHKDYGAFAGLAEGVLKSPGMGRIDDFGANPAMISALYNMGGR